MQIYKNSTMKRLPLIILLPLIAILAGQAYAQTSKEIRLQVGIQYTDPAVPLVIRNGERSRFSGHARMHFELLRDQGQRILRIIPEVSLRDYSWGIILFEEPGATDALLDEINRGHRRPIIARTDYDDGIIRRFFLSPAVMFQPKNPFQDGFLFFHDKPQEAIELVFPHGEEMTSVTFFSISFLFYKGSQENQRTFVNRALEPIEYDIVLPEGFWMDDGEKQLVTGVTREEDVSMAEHDCKEWLKMQESGLEALEANLDESAYGRRLRRMQERLSSMAGQALAVGDDEMESLLNEIQQTTGELRIQRQEAEFIRASLEADPYDCNAGGLLTRLGRVGMDLVDYLDSFMEVRAELWALQGAARTTDPVTGTSETKVEEAVNLPEMDARYEKILEISEKIMSVNENVQAHVLINLRNELKELYPEYKASYEALDPFSQDLYRGQRYQAGLHYTQAMKRMDDMEIHGEVRPAGSQADGRGLDLQGWLIIALFVLVIVLGSYIFAVRMRAKQKMRRMTKSPKPPQAVSSANRAARKAGRAGGQIKRMKI